MDRRLARGLIDLDRAFYDANAEGFSATRRGAWSGWRRVATLVRDAMRGGARTDGGGAEIDGATGGDAASPGIASPLAVVDVGCGNMRLAAFLGTELPDAHISYLGVDACVPLAATTSEPPANVSASFLERDLRAALMRGLVRAARPGGLVACSLWRFLDDPALAAKADLATAEVLAAPPVPGLSEASLEPGDRFLGWGGALATPRFCHHVDEAEADALVRASGAEEICRFSADSRTGTGNRYLVLRRAR